MCKYELIVDNIVRVALIVTKKRVL